MGKMIVLQFILRLFPLRCDFRKVFFLSLVASEVLVNPYFPPCPNSSLQELKAAY